jgi:hypothetical protein
LSPLGRMLGRTALHRALALAALAVGLEPLLVRSLGSQAPGWSHWWCSAPTASAAAHAAGTSGASGASGALHTTLAVLAVHWPHFLPIVLALGTVAYLWRAETQHRAAETRHPAAPRAPSISGTA